MSNPTVRETVIDMLRRYPSLYKNRLQVLQTVFGTSNWIQQGGEMVFWGCHGNDKETREEAIGYGLQTERENCDDPLVLAFAVRDEREYMHRAYVWDNAELLADLKYDTYGDPDPYAEDISTTEIRYREDDSFYPLNPELLNEEWRDALLEVAWATLAGRKTFPAMIKLAQTDAREWHRILRTAEKVVKTITGRTFWEILDERTENAKQLTEEILTELKAGN